MPTTEMEAYRRLFGQVPVQDETPSANEARLSVLPTLTTTTERTVAPGGSITMKVVPKN